MPLPNGSAAAAASSLGGAVADGTALAGAFALCEPLGGGAACETDGGAVGAGAVWSAVGRGPAERAAVTTWLAVGALVATPFSSLN